MKKHFWDLIEALRRENCFVCDQRNMNYFFRSYTPRKRHDFEYNKWPTATMAECQHRECIAGPRNDYKALARIATFRNRGSLLPTFDINAADGGHTPRLSKLSGK